jgi:heme exporter protein B
MKYFWHSFKAIFIKDMIAEFRSRQVLPTMLVLGMLIIWVFRIASETVSVNMPVIGSTALWVAFLFAGLLAQERSFASEVHQDCMDALLLAPVDEGTVYLAKLLVNIIMLTGFEVIIVPGTMLSFGLKVASGSFLSLVAVLMLGNIGISSVGTLFAAIVQLTNTRGSLLSVLVLTILMPMMIPATLALLIIFGAVPAELVGTGALAFVGDLRSAIGYMVGFDAVFVVACWLLFGFAIKE